MSRPRLVARIAATLTGTQRMSADDRRRESGACRTAKDCALPAYQTEHAAGLDLVAAVPDERR